MGNTTHHNDGRNNPGLNRQRRKERERRLASQGEGSERTPGAGQGPIPGKKMPTKGGRRK